jgi:hypothetical protein
LRRAIVPVASVVLLAVLLRLLYGRGLIGYDTSAALVWGDDLWHGHVPDFRSMFAPTPHPLSYVSLAPVSALGETAVPVVEAISWLSFAFLGYAAFRLGSVLFSKPVGLLFAAILLTRPLLLRETLQAFVDIPCLALVLLAAAWEVRRPRRGWPVLVLLGLAGLMRPESWLLAGAYALWAMRGRTTRERIGLAALAAAAPVIWALSDLAITGDPFFSLHNTQTAAERLGRPRGILNALDLTPTYLSEMLGSATVWCGLAGCLAALLLLYRRAVIPVAVLALGLGGFLVLGLAHLPLLRRYLFPAGASLALFCAVAILGWLLLERGRFRAAWMAGGLAAFAAVALSMPGVVRDLRDEHRLNSTLGSAQSSLRALISSEPARAAFRRCERVLVEDRQLTHQIASVANVPLSRIELEFEPARRRGLFVAGRSQPARLYYIYESAFRTYAASDLPGYRLAGSNRDWALWERC